MSTIKRATIFIKGMHCASCDVLVRREFSKLPGVRHVYPDHARCQAEVEYTGHLDKKRLNDAINPYGYRIVESLTEHTEPLSKRLLDSGAIAVILFILYYFARELKLLPELGTTAGSTLSYSAVFILGLVASTSTCMATSGSLFLATIGKLKQKSAGPTVLTALSFNIGRVLSYSIFGYIIGLAGKTVMTTLQMGPLLTAVVAAVMIVIGLDMLKIISFASFTARYTNALYDSLESKLINRPRQTALLLGAVTYLLPCGFTQTVQVYALGLASPVQSAIIMMIFALGTVPMLMAIGFAGSFMKSSYYPLFAKVMGVVIVMVGVYYITNVFAVYGLSARPSRDSGTAALVGNDGTQVIRMTVDSRGYTPDAFTVRAGKPVKWVINGVNVFGCWGIIVSPKLGIQKTLTGGEETVTFTAPSPGTYPFSCAMGMYRGVITAT